MVQGPDRVVPVCGNAGERWPVLPPTVKKLHWRLTDPAQARGTEDEIMQECRASRDEIESRVQSLLAQLVEGVD